MLTQLQCLFEMIKEQKQLKKRNKFLKKKTLILEFSLTIMNGG